MQKTPALYARVLEEGGFSYPHTQEEILHMGLPPQWFYPLVYEDQPAVSITERLGETVRFENGEVIVGWTKTPVTPMHRLSQLMRETYSPPVGKRPEVVSSELQAAFLKTIALPLADEHAMKLGWPSSQDLLTMVGCEHEELALSAKLHARYRAELLTTAVELLAAWLVQRNVPIGCPAARQALQAEMS